LHDNSVFVRSVSNRIWLTVSLCMTSSLILDRDPHITEAACVEFAGAFEVRGGMREGPCRKASSNTPTELDKHFLHS
jgi:hypothetical protein